MPRFEWDALKSLGNWVKHGMTLADARKLWEDPRRIYLRADNTHGETRIRIIGTLEGKTWTCVFTLRAGRYRLISLRRARKSEAHAYQCR